MDSDSGAVQGLASDIEDPPRRPLTFQVTRRELFTSLRSQAERWRAPGNMPAFKLKDLGTLADEELAAMIPALADGCRLSVSDGMVWGWAPADQVPRKLFPAERTTLLVLHAIDGVSTLGEIADWVADEVPLPERSFACARAVFLELVMARMAAPR
jgi:hypothetical protein